MIVSGRRHTGCPAPEERPRPRKNSVVSLLSVSPFYKFWVHEVRKVISCHTCFGSRKGDPVIFTTVVFQSPSLLSPRRGVRVGGSPTHRCPSNVEETRSSTSTSVPLLQKSSVGVLFQCHTFPPDATNKCRSGFLGSSPLLSVTKTSGKSHQRSPSKSCLL